MATSQLYSPIRCTLVLYRTVPSKLYRSPSSLSSQSIRHFQWTPSQKMPSRGPAARMSPTVTRTRMEQMAREKTDEKPKDFRQVIKHATDSGVIYVVQWNAAELNEMRRHWRDVGSFFYAKAYNTFRNFWSRVMAKSAVVGWNPLNRIRSPYPASSRREISRLSTGLYTNINEAFAQANLDTLKRLCSTSLFSTLNARLGRRNKLAVVSWELSRWQASPRVLARVAVPMPSEGDENLKDSEKPYAQQAIVEFRSLQAMQTGERLRSGEIVWPAQGEQNQKTVHEYGVLHRLVEGQRVVDDWYLWGFLRDDDVVTFTKFVKEREEQRQRTKKLMEQAQGQHPSHRTAQELMS